MNGLLDFGRLKFVSEPGDDCRDVINEVEEVFMESNEREGTSSSARWGFPKG